MINYETILSLFDDKLTLLEYLTKIEQALKNEQLTDITVTQTDASHVYFTFVFEDGSTIDTPTFTLPAGPQGIQGPQGEQGIQGEQGPAGADGADGVSVTGATINASNHLILSLSSGNTIDAGEIAGIKIIDAGSFTIASTTVGDLGETTITTSERDLLADNNNYIIKVTVTITGGYGTTVYYLYKAHDNYYTSISTIPLYYININKSNAKQNLWLAKERIGKGDINSVNATSGQVLTADGNGHCNWENVSGGTTLNAFSYSTGLSTATYRQRLGKIIRNAKGNVQGSLSIQIGTVILDLPINCISSSSNNIYYVIGSTIANASGQDLACYIIKFMVSSGNINTSFCNFTKIATDGTISTGTGITMSQCAVLYYNDTEIT